MPVWELDEQPLTYMKQALICEMAEARAQVEAEKIHRAKEQAKALGRPKGRRKGGLT